MRCIFLLALALWLPHTLASSTPDGREAMAEGVRLFRAGELAEARARLEQARKAGLDSRSLYYNLGVVCYQLRDYPAAERWFLRLLDGPDQALARYNLGLVALADKREPAARRWFASVLEADAPEKIHSLAAQQLARLDASGESAAVGEVTTGAFLSLGGGYDSNLSATPETSPSNRGSGYAELVAAGSVNKPLDGATWLTWDGLGFSVNYPGDTEFSQQLVQGRVAAMTSWNGWTFGARPGISRSWLGGEQLETRLGLELLAHAPSCWLVRTLGCRLSLAADRVDGGSGYRSYDGHWYQFRASSHYNAGRLEASAEYRLEINDRQDLRAPDYFASLSPTRHEWRLDTLYRTSPAWKIGAELSVRYSRYRDPHQWLASGDLIVQRRTDWLTGLGLVGEYHLDRNWLLRPRWWFRHQESQLERYDYRRHTLQLSLEGMF